jgi:ribulose-5-phosphate 4-epimerase/fuculose-1-phosphate aldolase
MNPLAIHFGLLRVSDMLLLSDSPSEADREGGGRILAGNRLGRPANKAGWAIHSAIHRRREDVNAAAHCHTVYGKVWSTMGRKLRMVDQDVCTFYGDALAVYENYGGVVVGSALGEGEEIAKALGEKGKGVILVNHGLLTVGSTVDEAGFLFDLLEHSCRVQIEMGRAGVEGREVPDREAEFNFGVASRPVSDYLSEGEGRERDANGFVGDAVLGVSTGV